MRSLNLGASPAIYSNDVIGRLDNSKISPKADPEAGAHSNHQIDPALVNKLNDSFSFCNTLNKTCTSNDDCYKDRDHNCSICWKDDTDENELRFCGPTINLDTNKNRGITIYDTQ